MTTISRRDDDQARAAATGSPREQQPARARDRLTSPALQGLLALCIYISAWVPFGAGALVHHPTAAQLLQDSPDPNFYAWCLRWWPYAIGHGLNPLYSAQIFAPTGHALAWVTTSAPLALLAAPLTAIAGPVVSFNLLAAVALPLAAWAAFVLCRRLTGTFWPALAGGAVFGFSSYQMNHDDFGQLNLTYCLLLPILAYLVLLWRDEVITARTFAILAAITMTVQFYLATEIFADMTAILAASLVIGFVLAGRSGRPWMLHLTKLMTVGYAIAVVLAAPYIGYALTTKPPMPLRNNTLDLINLVLPRSGGTLGIAPLAHMAAKLPVTSTDGYVGVPLLVLAILLALTGWPSQLVRFLSWMLAVILVAALGPIATLDGHRIAALPWAPFYHLPVLRSAYPARLMLFAFLALAVVTALWLAQRDSLRWLRWPLAVLVLAAIAVNASPAITRPHTTVPSFISSGRYRHSLSQGEIVLVVSKIGNAGILWQAESDFYMRLAGGFINEGYSRHHSDLPLVVQKLEAPSTNRVAAFEAFVKNSKIGAILVDTAHAPDWARIFAHIGLTGYRAGNVLIYNTNGCTSCRPWPISPSAGAH
jgi:hypothetical protein